MKPDLLSGIFKIINKDNKTSGTGFILSGKKIGVTCFHVVKDCLDIDKVQIQLTSSDTFLTANLISSSDAHQKDIALLEYNFPPSSHAFKIMSSIEGNSKDFKTYGFPKDLNHSGMWGYGRIGDITTDGDLQLIQTNEIQEGFSGAPIIETGSGLVAGICYTKKKSAPDGRGNMVAFAKMAEDLSKFCKIPLLKLADSQLAILRRNSFKAYSNSIDRGGRFQHLKIDDALLTGIQRKENKALFEPIVHVENKSLPLQRSLETLWEKDCPHSVITGAGGMGKTVSLVRLWEHYNMQGSTATPIPIYIALNEFNNLSKKNRKNFILKTIQKRYGVRKIKPLMKAPLSRDKKRIIPRFVFLLDGYNELALNRGELVSEIFELKNQEDYKGVQLVFTSRFDMRGVNQWQSFHHMALVNLTNNQIESYLDHPLPKDLKLLELLRNPMMLSMHAANSELPKSFDKEGLMIKEVTNTGEMLYNAEKLQHIKIHNNHLNLFSRYFRLFILEHFLPFLGWQMQEKGIFFIHRNKNGDILGLEEIIKFGFSQLITGNFYETFEMFDGHLEEDNWDLTSRKFYKKVVKDICCEELMLLIKTDSTYSFLHQNFRDYFAARHVENRFKIAQKTNEIPDILRFKPLGVYVRGILGELLSINYSRAIQSLSKDTNQLKFSKNNNLIENALDLFRGIYGWENLGYSLWNIINIYKEQNENLSGLDLSRLDLSRINLWNSQLSRTDKKTNFSESKLSETNFTTSGYSSYIRSLECSKDGEYILVGYGDGNVKIWNRHSGFCEQTLSIESYRNLDKAVYSSDEEAIIILTRDEKFIIFDRYSGKVLHDFFIICSGPINGGRFSKSKKFFIATDDNIMNSDAGDQVYIWDISIENLNKYPAKEFRWHEPIISIDLKDEPICVEFLPNENHIILAFEDSTFQVWNIAEIENPKIINEFHANCEDLLDIKFGLSEKWFIAIYEVGIAKILDIQNGLCLKTLCEYENNISSVAISNNDKNILISDYFGKLGLWDITTGSLISSIEGYSDITNVVLANGEDGVLAMIAGNYNIEIIDLKSLHIIQKITGFKRIIRNVRISSNNEQVAFITDDGNVKLWDIKSAKCYRIIQDKDDIKTLEFTYDGSKILTISTNDSVKLWEIQNRTVKFNLSDHESKIFEIGITKDSQLLSIAYENGEIKIWHIPRKTLLCTIGELGKEVHSTVFSIDNQRIAVCYINPSYEIIVWDINTKKSKRISTKRSGKFGKIEKFKYLPEYEKLVKPKRNIYFWNDSHDKWYPKNKKHNMNISEYEIYRRASFEGEGNRYVRPDADGEPEAVIYKRSSKFFFSKHLRLRGHESDISSANFSEDGQLIVTGSFDGTARVWDASNGKCILILPNIGGLNVQGADFRTIHKDSNFSKDFRKLLSQYCAILNEDDESEWELLKDKYSLS